jgi:hypothetical protein
VGDASPRRRRPVQPRSANIHSCSHPLHPSHRQEINGSLTAINVSFPPKKKARDAKKTNRQAKKTNVEMNDKSTENNKRIARNTLMLYIRMVLQNY